MSHLDRIEARLMRIEELIHESNSLIADNKVEIEKLKTKARVWGAVAGLVVTLAGFVISWLK